MEPGVLDLYRRSDEEVGHALIGSSRAVSQEKPYVLADMLYTSNMCALALSVKFPPRLAIVVLAPLKQLKHSRGRGSSLCRNNFEYESTTSGRIGIQNGREHQGGSKSWAEP